MAKKAVAEIRSKNHAKDIAHKLWDKLLYSSTFLVFSVKIKENGTSKKFQDFPVFSEYDF